MNKQKHFEQKINKMKHKNNMRDQESPVKQSLIEVKIDKIDF